MGVETLIRVEAVADRVWMRFLSIEESRSTELSLMQAEKVMAAFGEAIAEAKAFVPGTKPFSMWDV